MSATAFQRMRREAGGTKKEDNTPVMTTKEIKVLLDAEGIEYDAKAKKDELLKLLEGAE